MDEHDRGAAVPLGLRDPWTGALAVGAWDEHLMPSQPPVTRRRSRRRSRQKPPSDPARAVARSGVPTAHGEEGAASRQERAAEAAVYREVREGAAFREVRRRYRRFAFPASAACLAWYFAYVVAAVTAPGLMGRRVAGPVNVAMAAGLAQFATTFVVTWAYARHAGRWRDRAALDVRWETQERTR